MQIHGFKVSFWTWAQDTSVVTFGADETAPRINGQLGSSILLNLQLGFSDQWIDPESGFSAAYISLLFRSRVKIQKHFGIESDDR